MPTFPKPWPERLWLGALDVIFPIRCLGCGAPGKFICAPCADRLPMLEEPFCDICAQPGTDGVCAWCLDNEPEIDEIRAPYLYLRSSPIQKAVTMLKYGGIKALAPELADLLTRFLRDSPTDYATRNFAPRDFDYIVPIISHPRRVRKRGYSQAALLAAALSDRLQTPMLADALSRVRDAPSQLTAPSREARWRNVRDSFVCHQDMSGLTILLIDDLVTTGSTAAACAAALKQAGALQVSALAIARTPRRPTTASGSQ